MKTISILAMICSSLIFSGGLHAQNGNILVYTFTGDGFVHDNIEASAAALQEIGRELKVGVTVAGDPEVFESPLDDYDAIVFTNTNAEAFLTDRQREAFRDFIESGGGFMGIHGASTSEPEWDWFTEMLGGSFTRHPPYQAFDVRVVDPDHLSTRHLPDPWAWEDECYYHRSLNPGNNVLLAADLSTLEDDPDKEQGEKTDGRLPLAWYREMGNSRIFFTALGHSIAHYEDPLFRGHLSGGLRWVLGLPGYSKN